MTSMQQITLRLTTSRIKSVAGKRKAAAIVSLLVLTITLCTLLPQGVSAATGSFGNTGNGANNGGLVNILVATKYTLSEAATVNQIGGYASGPGHWKFGIYADNGGSPGTLLAANNDNNAVVAGDNRFSIGPVYLTPGTYWIAILTDAANRRYETGTTQQAAYILGYGISNSLPATFGTASGTQDYDYVAYALYSTGQATDLTVTCNPPVVPSSGSLDTTISGALTLASDGSTGVSGKQVDITYFDGSSWTSVGSPTTDLNGYYSTSWSVPASLPNGFYPVKAVFAGDSNYLYSDAVTSTNAEGILLLPEYIMGALAAVLACVGAFLIYKKGMPIALTYATK